ncbi:MAG: GMP reductase [Anaerolineales bacterium]|nr:GMP reductase [Anaerolineales bacterium]
MHIEREMKLDFADVLIRPKRSALPSRAKVEIDREFTYEIPGGRHINDLKSGGQLCPLPRLSKAQSMPRWHHPTCRCESPEISAYPRKRG